MVLIGLCALVGDGGPTKFYKIRAMDEESPCPYKIPNIGH